MVGNTSKLKSRFTFIQQISFGYIKPYLRPSTEISFNYEDNFSIVSKLLTLDISFKLYLFYPTEDYQLMVIAIQPYIMNYIQMLTHLTKLVS